MYDLIIIGAGPGGIALAAEACASGIKQSQILVLEKRATHNSAIRQLYPDQNNLIKDPPPDAPVLPILPPQDGYLFLDKTKFAASFAADVEPEKAAFMADSQVPWAVEALGHDQ